MFLSNSQTHTARWWLGLLWFLSSLVHGFSAYSNAELDQLEQEFIQQINLSDTVVRDPLVNDYINHLAKTLAEHGELTPPYFFIVKSNEINAFAGPGGYIGVNTQLILTSDTESELAAVMAHEMSHVKQHHLYRMLEHQQQMRIPMLASILASVALGIINPALSTGALMSALSGFAQDNINFVRANEKEADRIGIEMLSKSGLDPRGMAGFFKKMQSFARYRFTDNMPAILRTHPLDEERIAEAESHANTLATVTRSENEELHYDLFKERIRNIVSTDQKQMLDYYHYRCSQHSRERACRYGQALSLMNHNQYPAAITLLSALWSEDRNNLYYAIALANAYQGVSQFDQGIKILAELYTNFPDSYALLMAYSDILLASNHPVAAKNLLVVGNRQFQHDLPLCHRLARAQATSHQMGYAYFTLAECHLLQGERHDALRKLKLALTFAKKDHILAARIAAKMKEVRDKVE